MAVPARRVRWTRGPFVALAFLTIVPVPPGLLGDDGFDLAPALPWFPVVGAAVGALAGGVLAGVAELVGRAPAAVIGIAVLVLATGGLHQDGLADTFDGLGVRGDRMRRLAVMRDSTVGAFGVLALVVWALLLVTSLDRVDAVEALRTLIVAEALGRGAALLHAIGAPSARADGLGAQLPSHRGAMAAAGVLGAAIAVAAAGPARGGLALAVAGVVAALASVGARRAIGGSTGDTLGATASITGALVCVALAATWH